MESHIFSILLLSSPVNSQSWTAYQQRHGSRYLPTSLSTNFSVSNSYASAPRPSWIRLTHAKNLKVFCNVSSTTLTNASRSTLARCSTVMTTKVSAGFPCWRIHLLPRFRGPPRPAFRHLWIPGTLTWSDVQICISKNHVGYAQEKVPITTLDATANAAAPSVVTPRPRTAALRCVAPAASARHVLVIENDASATLISAAGTRFQGQQSTLIHQIGVTRASAVRSTRPYEAHKWIRTR
jgi:hypothetical protein